MTVTALVVAKAPIPGVAKTRLAATIGHVAAADLAAAALLDTLYAVAEAEVDRRVVTLAGNIEQGARPRELARALASFTVLGQRGSGLGERLWRAHCDAADSGAVLQIGMDTPQLSTQMIDDAATALSASDVLGPAEDGGWWALGLRNPALAYALRTVPMSTPTTGAETLSALTAAGASLTLLPTLRDVDHEIDLDAVAQQCNRSSNFWAAVREHARAARSTRAG